MVIDNLRSNFNFEHSGRSLVIFTPDAVLPRERDKEEEDNSRATRESLIFFAKEKSSITRDYLLLVVFSAIITSLGLILNNVAVIVGGMVIAPVLGPILAITIGIVLGKTRLIWKGISAEIIAVVLAMGVGLVFGLLIPDVEVNRALSIRMMPTMADLFIAMAAGAAGAFTLIKGELESGLVGVMVAASLLPVMCTAGIGLALGNRTMIVGPMLLLGGNYLALLLSNVLVFYLQGLKPRIWYKLKAKNLVKQSIIIITIAVVLLSIPLSFITYYYFYVEKPVDIIKTTIKERLVFNWDYRIESVEIEGNLINVYLYAEGDINIQYLQNIKQEIEKELAREYNINFRIIPVKEVQV